MSWQNTTLNYTATNGAVRAHSYDVFKQPLPDDCTATSLVMFVKNVQALTKDLALGLAHLQLRRAQAINNNQPADNQWHWGAGGASVENVVYALNHHHQRDGAGAWQETITMAQNLVQQANAAGVGNIVNVNMLRARLANCSVNQPAIVSIEWQTPGPGGHVAVCIGKQPMAAPAGAPAALFANPRTPEIVFLDPDFGVVAFDFATIGVHPSGLGYDTIQCSFGGQRHTGYIDMAIFS